MTLHHPLFPRALLCLACIGCGLCGAEEQDFQYVGRYKSHRLQANRITFACDNAAVQVEICADDVIRVRMRKQEAFLPNEPWVVIKYDWPPVDYKLTDEEERCTLTTSRLVLVIHKNPLRLDCRTLDGRVVCSEPRDGGMGFRGDAVICRKRRSPTDHFFGLGQRYARSDLRGTKNRLWTTENQTCIPFFMATDGYGIFFHNFWPTTFDFTRDPYTFASPGGKELDYYLIYGPSFKHILERYTEITGRSPLPPRWAFGMFESKWDKRSGDWYDGLSGQEGLLMDVKLARGEKKWPLDAIRIHSRGCSQNFWAGANMNWPDAGWGGFPSVDTMIQQLHAENIHPIFWETPGIANGCRMYQHGVQEGFYVMEDGHVWNGSFGAGPPGALVDFCNPGARRWWAQLHGPLIDAGSDGAAGDHGEEVHGSMYSPYSGMTGEEYHNIYAMLYHKASWDAYRERRPNKRCVVFGRSMGPGCQRYPMQGTQDSHEVAKDIHGEIMGCINFGLSGVPFRTFTDNAAARIRNPKGISVRVSQYLCLGVAGERTEYLWMGNKKADDNYRFYAGLRYRLMPYIYTYARVTTQTGLPLVRALVLENQDDPETYSVYGQYLLGEDILVAPLWSDKTFSRKVYLPAGRWFDFWDDTAYTGRQTITYDAPLDKVPILVKAGAIIPMAPEGQLYVDQKQSPLTVRVYPTEHSVFDLYEDDGRSYDYEKGVYALTRFACRDGGDELSLRKSAPSGSFKIPRRDHVFSVHLVDSATSVSCNHKALARVSEGRGMQSATDAWFHDRSTRVLWIKVSGGENRELSIRVRK